MRRAYMKKWSKALLQSIFVITLIIAGIMITKALIATKPKIKKIKPLEIAPFVVVEKVQPSTITVVINSEGTVSPSKQIEVVPQVSGKAVYVSENLVRGGRFKKGELLIRIEDSDYLAAVKKAEAEVKAQEVMLHRLREESKEARREWEEINPGLPAPALLLKLPDIQATEAAIAAAGASLQRARLDLQRTEISAPFSGVVISEEVDEGQYLRSGQPVARIFSDEKVEIRVSLNEKDAGLIIIPGLNIEHGPGSKAVVEASIGRRQYRWDGIVARAEIVDEGTRTIPVVIVVHNPYETMPPLSVGSFVNVRIKGREVDDAVILDKSAVEWTEDGRPFVWIIDQQKRLKRQIVNILRSADGRYIIDSGLRPGDVVVLTPPPSATEGMKVRTEGK
jgi:RND family efflux transporter MFP subunit